MGVKVERMRRIGVWQAIRKRKKEKKDGGVWDRRWFEKMPDLTGISMNLLAYEKLSEAGKKKSLMINSADEFAKTF